MARIASALLLIVLAVIAVSSQTRIFRWEDGLCRYRGNYDAKKYTSAQLLNTLKLLGGGGFYLSTNATVFDPADISKLDVDALDREYRKISTDLAVLDIVHTPYWTDLRRGKLAEIKQVYDLSRVSMAAYSDPNALLSLTGVETCKTRYARPLIAGGSDLLAAWKLVNEDSQSKNGDPARIKRIYEEQNASSDRMKYAFVEVMTFGWWNCANASIKYVKYDGTPEREFRKLFVKVKDLGCDEP